MRFDHYNLLVASDRDKWNTGSALILADRYLEHTVGPVAQRYSPLDDKIASQLVSMPALFAHETHNADPLDARVGRITSITHRSKGYFILFEFDEEVPPLPQKVLKDLCDDLDIDATGGELSRYHWAIKQVDLYAALRRRGVVGQPTPVSTSSTARAPQPSSLINAHASDLTRAMSSLGSALHDKLEGKGTVQPPDPAPPRQENMARLDLSAVVVRPKVLVVHGNDPGPKFEVARFLEQLELDAVILHERASGGKTVLTKFDHLATGVVYAVVLMTGDDVGGLKAEPQALTARARQNVIFELGFVLAKLGLDRVCALRADGVEIPSDYNGVVYEP